MVGNVNRAANFEALCRPLSNQLRSEMESSLSFAVDDGSDSGEKAPHRVEHEPISPHVVQFSSEHCRLGAGVDVDAQADAKSTSVTKLE